MQFNSTPRVLLTGVILELTLATALIHFSLGGTLFLLNAAGYLGLGALYLAAAVVPVPAIRRISWLPKVGLAGFAAVTILAYVATGNFFLLGWVTKWIELAIVTLVIADLFMKADAGRAPGRPPTSA